jgi:hypothetical protein
MGFYGMTREGHQVAGGKGYTEHLPWTCEGFVDSLNL